MSAVSYSVVIDPLFNSLMQSYFTNIGGKYVDSLGNERAMLNASIELKKLDQNSADVVISGILRFENEAGLARVTFTGRTVFPDVCLGMGCHDAVVDITLFDAYIDGVTLKPGYYLFVVRISVKSGVFTLQQ